MKDLSAMDRAMSMAFIMLKKEEIGGGGLMAGISKSQEEIVIAQKIRHNGDWLAYEVAANYHKKAEALGYGNNELTRERFHLCKELQEKYDVTELEATNILMAVVLQTMWRNIRELKILYH